MKERMLVIDDDTAVLLSCEAIFGNNGFEVETTVDPREGLELSTKKHYNVILCDWKMPGFNGLDVSAELEERAPDSAVVMFSGYPSVDRATEAIKRGAMDFLAKPFTPDEIIAVVQKAAGRKLKQEKKVFTRFEKMWDKFPIPSIDDKGPKIIAETVAQNVGVAKANSPWMSLFVLGILAGAYIGEFPEYFFVTNGFYYKSCRLAGIRSPVVRNDTIILSCITWLKIGYKKRDERIIITLLIIFKPLEVERTAAVGLDTEGTGKPRFKSIQI